MAVPLGSGYAPADDPTSVPALMARLAAGDTRACFELYEHHGRSMLGAVRAHARALGVRLHNDEADELVREVCLDLATSGRSWRPDGGAAPWRWPERRVRAIVVRHCGALAASPVGAVDSAETAALLVDRCGATGRDVDALALLDALALRNPFCALLAEALRSSASTRDAAIFLQYVIEQSDGNASPAVTVATSWSLRADAVRQVVHRVRRRLVNNVQQDRRFVDLQNLPLLKGSF